MKEKDAANDFDQQVVYYVEREDHTYGPLQTGSYLSRHYLDDYLAKVEHWRAEALGELLAGKISAVGYYARIVGIADADLAERVRVSRRKVRRHFTPEGFADLSLPLLRAYAEVFDIPLADLFQVVIPAEGGPAVHRATTGNPLLTLLRVGEKP